MTFSPYNLLIYRKSIKVIGEIAKPSLQKILRIPTVFFLFRYHVFLLTYFTSTNMMFFLRKMG